MTTSASPGRRPFGDDGFSLVELMVVTTLMLVIFGVASTFLWTQTLIARAQPDAADLQQRARVVTEILSSRIASAGTWAAHAGPGDGYTCCVPAILPRRLGLLGADPVTVAHPDAVTFVRAAPGAQPGRLREPLPGLLTVENTDGCTAARPVCGVGEDDHVLVFKESGAHDFYVVDSVAAESASLTARQVGGLSVFAAGDRVLAVETSTVYFDPAARQLRAYDGYRSDVPVVDDVVAVRFEYWGTTGVPVYARGAPDVETCWFDSAGSPRFGRALSPAGARDIRIALDEFTDGPWCGTGGNTFDADLLRIRRVRAVVRLRAAPDSARGRGVLFLSPGRATHALRLVNDLEVIIDATSRALSAAY